MEDFSNLLVIAGVTKYFSCGLVFIIFLFNGNISELFSLFTQIWAKLKHKDLLLEKSVLRLVSHV